MWQTVPDTSFSKFMVYPGCMYVILTTCIKVVNTVVLIKLCGSTGSLLCEIL